MNLLVIGDTIIDKSIYANAVGLSLESPTLKSNYKTEKSIFGGAANVAINAHRFGSEVTFLTSVTQDYKNLFEKENPGIQIHSVGSCENIKTRVYISKGDHEYKYLQINQVNRQDLDIAIDLDLEQFDLIAISDYRCGLINQLIVDLVSKTSAVTYASSQESDLGSNLIMYSDFDFIVCNEKESKAITRRNNVIITKGPNGCEMNGLSFVPQKIKKKDIKTTIGAGDVFYASYLAKQDLSLAVGRASRYVKGTQ